MTKVIVPPLAAKILTPSLVASHWLNQYRRLLDDTAGVLWTSQVAEGVLRPLVQALRTMQRDRQAFLRIVFRPGTPIGDVLLVLDPDCADDVRYQALRRLAAKHLALRYVYQASPGLQRRWSIVRPHFEAYCREHGLSYTQAWEQLTVPIICDLTLSLPGDVTFGELRWYLARELRKEIERELLGRTVDQHDPIDRLVVAEDVPDELADVRLEVWLALQRLDPVDRELLVAVFVHGRSYRELAEQYGVSESTICRRVANALRRIRMNTQHLA
jgi:RNA polymerase sigma factor (sigma-70 family)